MNEDIFILNASRTFLSGENVSRLKTLPGQGINWDILTEKISKHNVANLIYYSLTSNNLSHLIPEKLLTYLKNEYYKAAYLNSIFIEEVNKLSEVVDDKIILLKGVDLAQTLYPNVAARPMCDIDVLIEKENANKIWNDLQTLGFKSKPKKYIYKSSIHDKYASPLPVHFFGLYTKKCMLEIHWNLFVKENLFSLTHKAWDTSRRFKDNLYLLSNEMMLVYLCSHYYRHSKKFTSLRMLCDINELILRYKLTLDWNKVKDTSFNNELKEKIKFVLTYCAVLLDTPVPAEFIDQKIFNNGKISLDNLTPGEKIQDILERYIDNLKKIYKPNEFIVFAFRTIIPVREWIISTYKLSSAEKLWQGYLKYWKYLFLKYLLFRRIQLGN